MKIGLFHTGCFQFVFILIGISVIIPCCNVAASDAPTPSTSGSNAIRIYNCDQPVQSSKRGICANKLSPEDIQALAPGVSWYYNWHYNTDDTPPKGVHFDFFPMAFGRDGDLDGLADYLASHPKPRVVLALNEPNIRGQAFLTPEATAALYSKIKAVADKYGVPVIGPHLAMGSAPEDSIVEMDPIDKKTVTYRFMVPYLKAFNFYMGNTEVPATAFHSYGNIGEVKWSIGMMKQTFNKPAWVTEYGLWRSKNQQEVIDHLIKATDLLESSSDVGGYAWFKERCEGNPSMSLLAGSGELTALGKAYVALPVHDTDVYYRIPGRLPADHYVSVTSALIEQTNDESGMFDMTTHKEGVLDYQIQVDKEGQYSINMRVSGPSGAIQLLQNGQVLATADSQTPAWHDETATVKLAAGPQILRIHTTGQTINWIEFAMQQKSGGRASAK